MYPYKSPLVAQVQPTRHEGKINALLFTLLKNTFILLPNNDSGNYRDIFEQGLCLYMPFETRFGEYADTFKSALFMFESDHFSLSTQ